MSKFIELTVKGKKSLFNADTIICFEQMRSGCRIYQTTFADLTSKTVEESYEQVKVLLATDTNVGDKYNNAALPLQASQCNEKENEKEKMTYEEAKNNIDKNLDCGDVNNIDSEALCMAVEALEKKIPKKPIRACKIRYIGNSFIARDEDEYLKCPNCGCIKTSDNLYCEMCGQAIDWSGEE